MPGRSDRRRWTPLVCGALLLASLLTSAARAAADPPRLVVILVIDQLRADYLVTYGPQWSRGLRRLIDGGALFTEAVYPYLSTVTCAGHATVATGSFPATHGMISNGWWDRASGRYVRCTVDPETAVVSYGAATEGGESPHRLLAPTLADEMRLQLDGSRVATFSLKERSAIMLAGQRADALLWLGRNGSWLTSGAYTERPVPFLTEVMAAHPMATALGDVWVPALAPERYLYEDDADGERPPAEWGRAFPHPLIGVDGADGQFVERWKTSPWSDAYLARLAGAAVEGLELGQRDATDYLAIGFSALDLVGHRFGPRSHEVQDLLVQLDETIGGLLDELDRRVGAGRYVVALSADHGVSPVPEQMLAAGFDAGRVRTRPMRERVEQALAPHLGAGPHVARVTASGVYFAPGVYARLGANAAALQAAVDALRASPVVARVFRRETLAALRTSTDPDARAVALSFHPERSGDLMFTHKPYWIGGNAASHGTAHLYDRRVPVLLYGAGVRPGRYAEATPADIAPTLARLVGVTLARPDGRVLADALVP